jgi:oleate hydratase
MNSIVSNQHRKIYLVGSGIASLASAAYFIKDGKISGDQIYIFEELAVAGGSLDGSGNEEKGYVLRGVRMLNFSYLCTYDLLSFIPSLSAPGQTVLAEIEVFNQKVKSHSLARVVEKGVPIDVSEMGFSNKDRLDLIELLGVTEEYLETKTIKEWFEPAFFETNFWYMWATMFAFQSWHSAVEFKRYLNRFIHEFERINTLDGIDRTPYNQYDSIVKPLKKWLQEQGVLFEMEAEVTDLDFRMMGEQMIVEEIHYVQEGRKKIVYLAEDDLVLITAGSMTADSSQGTMHQAPVLSTTQRGGSWALWESIAKECPEFGRPSVFNSRVPESLWESFTVTCQGTKFFDLMETFSGNKAGTGGLVTFKDSNWLMSIVLAYQPHFIGQPEYVTVFWGYGLFPYKEGNFVKKKMADCTGEEIMIELISHLRFNWHMDELLETSNCIPCLLPYITSQFLTRTIGDRPLVVPKISKNLAFIGQFAEVPLDVVFTVEYSVRTAQTAVYELLDLKKKPIPMYQGTHHATVLFKAIKSLVR